MKLQKSITLTIDYECIDISPNWVAFNISKTLETTSHHSGITDRNTWNQYLENPFVLPSKNIITYGVALIKPDLISTDIDFKTLLSDKHCLFDFNFDYHIFKNNPLYCLYRRNLIYQKEYTYLHHDEFNYLTDFDNKVVYFEHYIDLPLITQSKENEHIFSCLYNLMQNPLFDIVPQKDSSHKTREDYIEIFDNALTGINDVSLAHFKISDGLPELTNELGTLTFKIENFNSFDEFFQLTKKYIELQGFQVGQLCDVNFNLIISLALLKTYHSNVVHDDFFMLFPKEYKLAQSIFLDYKLKAKNHIVKKSKI